MNAKTQHIRKPESADYPPPAVPCPACTRPMDTQFQHPLFEGAKGFWLVTCQYRDCDHDTTESAHRYTRW